MRTYKEKNQIDRSIITLSRYLNVSEANLVDSLLDYYEGFDDNIDSKLDILYEKYIIPEIIDEFDII